MLSFGVTSSGASAGRGGIRRDIACPPEQEHGPRAPGGVSSTVVRYVVTIEPEVRETFPDALPVRAIVDAESKDDALALVETCYRGMHPVWTGSG